jgi:hypothetical protein
LRSTILFDAGASAPDVQASLGHSSLQVTERYSRAREGVALRAGAALNDALKKDEGALPETEQRRTSACLNGTASARARRNRPLKRENPRLPGGNSRLNEEIPVSRSLTRISVAPTGIDPVTFRFSVERSTN